jgi:hypothetical protein
MGHPSEEVNIRSSSPRMKRPAFHGLAEALGPRKLLERALELQLASKRELLESSVELAAEDAAENTDGQVGKVAITFGPSATFAGYVCHTPKIVIIFGLP